jgi:hypothetical protein
MTAPDIAETVPDDALESSDVKLNRDGSVRRKPGPKPGSKRTPRRAPAPGLRVPSAGARKASSADYRPAILGLMQIPQLALGLGAKLAKNEATKEALVLDGMTVGIHAPNVAEALNTTAQTEQQLARILDKLSTVGPYSLVVMALLTPTVQILANHGIVAPNEQMGVLPKEALAAQAIAMAATAG